MGNNWYITIKKMIEQFIEAGGVTAVLSYLAGLSPDQIIIGTLTVGGLTSVIKGLLNARAHWNDEPATIAK